MVSTVVTAVAGGDMTSRRDTTRTPEEVQRLQELRGRFQAEKPGPDQLEAEGHVLVPLGAVRALRGFIALLRQERERRGLSLRDLSAMTGIDDAALSRLETGKNLNPTFDTLARVAAAFGMTPTMGLAVLEGPPTGSPVNGAESRVESPVTAAPPDRG
jgi:DNA-binding Xre family transcriptional regulator